jgi:hypothetical protein
LRPAKNAAPSYLILDKGASSEIVTGNGEHTRIEWEFATESIGDERYRLRGDEV